MKTNKNRLSVKYIIIATILLLLCSFCICIGHNLYVKAEEGGNPVAVGSLTSNDYEMGCFSLSRLQYNGYVPSVTLTEKFDLWADDHTTYEIIDDKFIITVSGYESYLYNYTSTITVVPKEGYVFDHWEVDDEIVISQYYDKNSCPKKLVAVFEEELPSYYSVMDDIYFIHEHQQESGLCWDFSFLNALEILYAKQLNEVVNYSELWISILAHKCTKVSAASNPGQIGAGYDEVFNVNGTWQNIGERLLEVIDEYGILFENDLPFEKYYHVDDSNYQQYLNAYKGYTSNLLAPVKEVRFDNYNQSSNEETKNAIITKMKKHIRENGNMLTCVTGESIKYINGKQVYYSTNFLRNHAICVVGWDDNLVVEINGQTHKGAWIIQNSYVNNDQGLYYVLYDDVPVSVRAYGYKLDESVETEMETAICQSQHGVKINNVNALNSAENFNKSEKLVAQKNVIEYTDKDNIELTYLCVKDNIYGNVKVKILYNNSETDAFSISSKNIGTSTYYTLTSTQNLKSGVYVVKFYYYASYSGSNEPLCTTAHQIFITDNVNIAYCTNTNTKSVINSMDYNEKQIYSFVYSDQQRADFTIGFGRYSKIISAQNCKINNNANSTCSLGGMLIAATETSYTAGYIALTYQINDPAGTILDSTFEVTTLNGYTFTFQVYIYILEKEVDNIVFVDYVGPYDSLSGGSFCYAIGKNFELKLSEPTRKDYKDPNLIVNGVNVPASNNLNIEKLIFSTGSNFDDVNYPGTRNYDRYSAVVLFDWGDDVLSIPNAQVINLTYGQSFDEFIKQDLKGSNNYSIGISSKLSWISYNSTQKCLTGTPNEIGTFTITYNVRDNSLNIMKSVEITLVVEKAQLEYEIEDTKSFYGEKLKDINITLKSGSILASDNVKLEVLCDATKTSKLGDYPITLKFKDESLDKKYDLVFNEASYTILINRIKCDPQNYNAEYDGKFHTVNLNLKNVAESDCDISYWVGSSQNEQNSTKEKIYYKDCTNGEITISYKITKYGYETYIGSNTISIRPRVLTIEVLNDTLYYDGAEKLPEIQFANLVAGETVDYEMVGSAIEIGKNYKATVQLNSDNYVLESNEVIYSIVNKPLNTTEIIIIVASSVGVLIILLVVVKFIIAYKRRSKIQPSTKE